MDRSAVEESHNDSLIICVSCRMHVVCHYRLSVSLLYIPQSLLALEYLRLSHTIICWSFEFLDVVMGEVVPHRIL